MTQAPAPYVDFAPILDRLERQLDAAKTLSPLLSLQLGTVRNERDALQGMAVVLVDALAELPAGEADAYSPVIGAMSILRAHPRYPENALLEANNVAHVTAFLDSFPTTWNSRNLRDHLVMGVQVVRPPQTFDTERPLHDQPGIRRPKLWHALLTCVNLRGWGLL